MDQSRAMHWVVDRTLRAAIGVALMLPYERRVRMMGRLMRSVIAPLAGYEARSCENLAMIFPDIAADDRRRLARAVADNVGRTLIENYSGAEFLARLASEEPHGAGLAALESARAQGRPAILVSGHFGNYEAPRAALVARGHAIGGLYKPMRNPYFNAHYVRTMEGFGGPVFPQGAAGTKGFVRHLKAGGMLVLLIDQRMATGEPLDFLGQPARTALSAAELALRYDAVLLPFYGTRRADGLTFDVEIEAAVPPSDPVTMTQALNDSLAARVRTRPEQYFWVHRRWRP